MSASSAWEMGAKRAKTPARGAPSRHCGHVSAPNHGQRSFVQTFLGRLGAAPDEVSAVQRETNYRDSPQGNMKSTPALVGVDRGGERMNFWILWVYMHDDL